MTTFDIDLGTGSSNKVMILDSVAKGLDFSKTTSYNWAIPEDKYKDDGKVYCFRFSGIDPRGDVTTTSWTTWFTMVNGTVQTTTTVQPQATVTPIVAPTSEIKATSGASAVSLGALFATFAMML